MTRLTSTENNAYKMKQDNRLAPLGCQQSCLSTHIGVLKRSLGTLLMFSCSLSIAQQAPMDIIHRAPIVSKNQIQEPSLEALTNTTIPSPQEAKPSTEELKELKYWLFSVEQRAHEYLALQMLCFKQFGYWLPLPTCLSIKGFSLPHKTIEPADFFPEENGALRFFVTPAQCNFLRSEALLRESKIIALQEKNKNTSQRTPSFRAVPINSTQELLFSAYGIPTFSLFEQPAIGCQLDFATQKPYGYILQPQIE